MKTPKTSGVCSLPPDASLALDDLDIVSFHPDVICRDGVAGGSAQPPARLDVDPTLVPGALHGIALQDTLSQRAATVRALVAEGVNLAVDAGQGDLVVFGL